MINTGELDQRVELYQIEAVVGESVGELIEQETLYATRWARVRATAAGESTFVDGQQASKSFEVLLRLDEAIGHTWRLKWRGMVLGIDTVLHDRTEASTTIAARTVEGV